MPILGAFLDLVLLVCPFSSNYQISAGCCDPAACRDLIRISFECGKNKKRKITGQLDPDG